MADFLVLDVGGANLVVEIDTQGATEQRDYSGISEESADDGSPMISVAYDVRRAFTWKSKWLSTEEYQAVIAAAKYPQIITIGGHFARTTTPNTTPQTIRATVKVSQADFFAEADNFLHVASLAIQEYLNA